MSPRQSPSSAPAPLSPVLLTALHIAIPSHSSRRMSQPSLSSIARHQHRLGVGQRRTLNCNPAHETLVRCFTHFSHNRKALPTHPSALRVATDSGDSRSSTTQEGPGGGAGGPAVLRMLIFGKPGVGKGTLTARLVKKYDILALSTGDMLRQHILDRSAIGKQAEGIVAQGGLLPDELMLKVVSSKLDLIPNKHWILDGFPRTVRQGELLDAHLRKQHTPLSLVVNIDVADHVILRRISDRWVHLPSGRIYNMSYNRPKVEGRDDVTGELLTKRPDDNPEVFARRLAEFYKSTSPLLAYYAAHSSTKLVTLTGATSDEIWPKLDSAVRTSFPSLRERLSTPEGRRKHSLNDALLADGSHDIRDSARDQD